MHILYMYATQTHAHTHVHTHTHTPGHHLCFDIGRRDRLGGVDPGVDSNVPQADPKGRLKDKYSVEQVHQLRGNDILEVQYIETSNKKP